MVPRRLTSLPLIGPTSSASAATAGPGPATDDSDSSDDADEYEHPLNAFLFQSIPSKKGGRPQGAGKVVWGPVVHTVLRSKFPTDKLARKEALRLKDFPNSSTEHHWIREGKYNFPICAHSVVMDVSLIFFFLQTSFNAGTTMAVPTLQRSPW
jgi:hypothetical protein